MHIAACFRSADGSMIALTLPAPTVTDGVPARCTTLISAFPPVATAKSHFCIRVTVFSLEGSAITWNRSSGAPIALSAFLPQLTAFTVASFVLGCGEQIIAFLVLRSVRPMKAAVIHGFVHGHTLATTPIGFA